MSSIPTSADPTSCPNTNPKAVPALSTAELETEIRTTFELPIQFNAQKRVLDADIVRDLELTATLREEGAPILDKVFGKSGNSTKVATHPSVGGVVRCEMAKYYTNDTRFIEDTQRLLREWKCADEAKSHSDCDDMFVLWNELRHDKNFKEKYIYLDWGSLLFLNKNQSFLQALSVYNLISPVLALLVPLVIVIVPFFIMISRGQEVSFSKYAEILKTVASNHAVVRLFTGFGEMTLQQKLYSVMSVGFYLLSLYQNTQICAKFYTNLFKIHEKLFAIKEFASNTIREMDAFLTCADALPCYSEFCTKVRSRRQVMEEMRTAINDIPPCEVAYAKLLDMGKVMKWFYAMHTEEGYHDAVLFSLGFMGYVHNMRGVQRNLTDGVMQLGTLIDKDTAAQHKKKEKKEKKKRKKGQDDSVNRTVKGVFHPSLLGEGVSNTLVKNDVVLKKDCVITGPNASGKTTMLKSLFLSILFTQQYGCGFYDACSFVPYTHLHCYLNIPDTSGRDSLFQSESRKCKDILDSIRKDGADSHHFCLFDELYSGTNPAEAVKCGFAYLCHLSDNENIHYVLTTHYNDLCEKLREKRGLTTYRMMVNVPKGERETGALEYTYRIEEGVNEVDGGVEVLRQMEYPTEILANID